MPMNFLNESITNIFSTKVDPRCNLTNNSDTEVQNSGENQQKQTPTPIHDSNDENEQLSPSTPFPLTSQNKIETQNLLKLDKLNQKSDEACQIQEASRKSGQIDHKVVNYQTINNHIQIDKQDDEGRVMRRTDRVKSHVNLNAVSSKLANLEAKFNGKPKSQKKIQKQRQNSKKQKNILLNIIYEEEQDNKNELQDQKSMISVFTKCENDLSRMTRKGGGFVNRLWISKMK